MADDGTIRRKAIAEVLERVFGTEVLVEDQEDYWTQKADEVIEEIEAEGLLLE